MGWNSWNHFNCHITEEIVLDTAQRLIDTGLAQKGYKYVNMDDCWLDKDRDADGNIQPVKQKFPHGIKWLANKLHEMGLYLGLYGCSGTKTCAGRVGSWGHEEQDAELFASWDIDYLKYDNCNIPPNLNEPFRARFQRMRDALLKAGNKTGRHIFYSVSAWGQDRPALWPGKKYANSWRTGGDIVNRWDSVIGEADQNHWFAQAAGPGGWNDPDMLEIGNGVLTLAESRSHFSLWALQKAPLLIGCDLHNITPETLEILGNEDAIAINQDPLGIAGTIDYGPFSRHAWLWYGPLSGDRVVALLHNRLNVTRELSASCLDLHIPTLHFEAHEVWRKTDQPSVGGRISAFVEPHDSYMYIVHYRADKHAQKCDPAHIARFRARKAPPPSPPAAPAMAAAAQAEHGQEETPPTPTVPETPPAPTIPETPPTPTVPVIPPTSTVPVNPPTPTIPVNPPTPIALENPPTPTIPMNPPPTPTVPVNPPTPTAPVNPPTPTPQETPQAPTVLETPPTPSVPETPPTPTVPETPPTSTVPETPPTPTVPETPPTPTVPETPPAPTVPETLPAPTVPETPPAPAVPEIPPTIKGGSKDPGKSGVVGTAASSLEGDGPDTGRAMSSTAWTAVLVILALSMVAALAAYVWFRGTEVKSMLMRWSVTTGLVPADSSIAYEKVEESQPLAGSGGRVELVTQTEEAQPALTVADVAP